jgi:hypothetical protein
LPELIKHFLLFIPFKLLLAQGLLATNRLQFVLPFLTQLVYLFSDSRWQVALLEIRYVAIDDVLAVDPGFLQLLEVSLGQAALLHKFEQERVCLDFLDGRLLRGWGL